MPSRTVLYPASTGSVRTAAIRTLFENIDSGVLFTYAPKQKDAFSCGIYLMLWIRSLLVKSGIEFLTPETIPFMRLWILSHFLIKIDFAVVDSIAFFDQNRLCGCGFYLIF